MFLEEKKHLMTLPDNPYPCEERQEVRVGKTPYARFDLNDYSVPHALVSKTLVVHASPTTVRILDAEKVVATHPRSYDRGQQIEDPVHIDALRREKTAAGTHSRTDLLAQAVPNAPLLLEQIASRGLPLGRVIRELQEMLYAYGQAPLVDAISEALTNDSPHMHAVRQVLERTRHEQGKPPPLPLSLPDDPRVKNLVVTPHRLSTYDNLLETLDDDDDTSIH